MKNRAIINIAPLIVSAGMGLAFLLH
jgi:hypothetical protein